MKTNHKTIEPKWLVVSAFFAAGIFLGGMTLYLLLNIAPSRSFKLHLPQGSYKYINPILAVDAYENSKFGPNRDLALQFQGLIASQKKVGDINDASVYFRDIEPGLWVGINEDAQFSPGKLLKIPLMIVYYKLAETNPKILDDQLVFQKSHNQANSIFKPTTPLQLGQGYTVSELIDNMIIENDDEAAYLLFDHVDKIALNEIFSDLGISFKENSVETDDYISLKLYSLFFRILYNATYLNREYSEKALKLMDQTDSTLGLGRAIPRNIPVANRFGARAVANNLFEFYECGIFYYPGHAYLLCALARGGNLEKIQDFFSLLGVNAYQAIDYKYH